MLEHMPEHCQSVMLEAMQVEQCTYVRTYSRRTTHLDLLTNESNARGGAARNCSKMGD